MCCECETDTQEIMAFCSDCAAKIIDEAAAYDVVVGLIKETDHNHVLQAMSDIVMSKELWRKIVALAAGMTPEEIRNLSDERLTEMVAEREGGHRYIDGYGRKYGWYCKTKGRGALVAPSGWSPSTRIEDAWPLFDDFPKGTFIMRMCDGRYCVDGGPFNNLSEFVDKRASRAITEAWLWAQEETP